MCTGGYAKTATLCFRGLNICVFGCEEAMEPTLSHPQTLKYEYQPSKPEQVVHRLTALPCFIVILDFKSSRPQPKISGI